MARRTASTVQKFTAAHKWLAGLDDETASRLITVSSDVALVLEAGPKAVIADISFGSDELAQELKGSMRAGKSLYDLVTVESRPKIDGLMKDARAEVPPRWRQVNQLNGDGGEIPISYSAVAVGHRGCLVVLGRSMRRMAVMQGQLIEAQRSMEREYSRLRQVETRHRLLFQVAAEAVVIVDGSTGKIAEANPAAIEVLGAAARRIVGRSFYDLFDAENRRALEPLFAKVAAIGHSGESPVRFSVKPGHSFRISASQFHEGRSAFYMVRLSTTEAATGNSTQQRRNSQVVELVASSPDGFVVTDMKGRLRLANRAFLELVQLASEEQALNETLDRWFAGPGVDFGVLIGQLQQHQTLRLFPTTLRGEYGAATDVEICGVAVPDAVEPCCGFTIRDVSRRLSQQRNEAIERPRSVEQLTELVGRVPLKQLIRESTDMIERLCIEAALELTQDNRASAAEMLGLSRQSLYAKLHRHGIAEIGGEDARSSGRRSK